MAAEWEKRAPYERSDFVLEWPILEDRLAQLGKYDEAGLLTPALRRRYGQLLALVARHRPGLERLFHRYAAEQGRVFVTYNRTDFQALDGQWRAQARRHAGIL